MNQGTFKLSYILVSTQHEIQVGAFVQQRFKSVCASALIDVYVYQKYGHSCQGIVLRLGKYCPHYPVSFLTPYVLRLKDEKGTFKLSYILVSTQNEIQVGACVQQRFKSVCASALIDVYVYQKYGPFLSRYCSAIREMLSALSCFFLHTICLET